MNVGGQAVVEGVMMRKGRKVSTAIRKGGKILFQDQTMVSMTTKNKFFRIPLVRGFVFLVEMIIMGMRSLLWSAGQQDEGGEISDTEATITVGLALVLGAGLFILLPYWLAGFFAQAETLQFNAIDGLLRLGVLLLYLYLISKWEDMYRVFKYHGAEHKVVNCHEAKKKLTVKNCRASPLFHPRCGTSLLLYVVLISIFVFAILRSPHWYYNILARLVLVPFIMGISYEALMWTARYTGKSWMKALILPGRWTQALTTRTPDDQQLRVAIAAIKRVL